MFNICLILYFENFFVHLYPFSALKLKTLINDQILSEENQSVLLLLKEKIRTKNLNF